MKKGIAEVPGIFCGVGFGGIKKKGPDVLVIATEKPCEFAAVFTKNDVKAAPVKVSMEIKGKVSGIVANSGNANACTGERGIADTYEMSKLASQLTGKGKFLVASTGVIGEPLPMEKVRKGIAEAVSNLGKATSEEAARAVMTTDTFPKVAFAEGEGFVVGGIAKGAGMIDPSMATMLSFVATDAEVPKHLLEKALRKAVESSFNAITVDGDMSTNDCVFLLSTAKSKKLTEKEFEEFTDVLTQVLKSLAYQIVKDGEGATKVIRVKVEKARDLSSARKVARKIALSPLVKTAVFGGDPNWGRIAAAAGSAGVGIEEEKLEIYVGKFLLFKGKRIPFKEKEVSNYIKTANEVEIRVVLNQGKESFEYLTCDLSYDYVRINAEYRT